MQNLQILVLEFVEKIKKGKIKNKNWNDNNSKGY